MLLNSSASEASARPPPPLRSATRWAHNGEPSWTVAARPRRSKSVGSDERSGAMNTKLGAYLGLAVALLAIVWVGSADRPSAQQGGGAAVQIDGDDIGGVVTGPAGPEAGVWVIAETTDLPTKFARIVVTDDQGRYVVPDLPKAKYK